MTTASIGFDIFARDRSATSTFDKIGNSADRTESRLKKFGAGAAKAAKFAAAGIAVAGTAAFAAGVKLYQMGDDALDARDRINQIATSMGIFGKEAGAVTDRLVKYADATARATGFDQNQIKATQAKLLTFKDLATSADEVGGAFDRATLAAVDLEAAGFGNAASNAVQLGKALNDPIKGLTALTKSGITFTASEQERIKAMVEAGNVGKAQAQILKAIETQVGGTAEAMAGPMDRLRVVGTQLAERFGQKLVPVVEDLATLILTEGLPAMQKFGGWIQTNLFPIFERAAQVVSRVMGTLRGDVSGNLDGIREAIGDFVIIAQVLWEKFGSYYVDYLKKSFQNIRQVLKGAFQIIGGILKVFSAVLRGDWKKAWEGVKQIFAGAANVIQGSVKQLFNVVTLIAKVGGRAIVDTVKGIPGLLRALGGKFLDAGKWIIGRLFEGLKAFGSIAGNVSRDLMNAIIGPINAGINYINDKIPNKIAIPGAPDIDLPDNPFPPIPSFARGVTNFRGGLAFVHGGEVLANLPRGTDVIPKHRVGAGGGTQQPVIVQLVLPNGKVIEQILIEHSRTTGRPLQVRTLGATA